MKVTHQDVIDYILIKYNRSHYKVQQDGKLHIKRWVPFKDFKFNTLPQGMVFEVSCDLDNSCITSIPDDIVLNSGLFLDNTKNITVPAIYINQNLYAIESDITLTSGTYIRGCMHTSGSRYWYLTDLVISGYIVSTGSLFGVLS